MSSTLQGVIILVVMSFLLAVPMAAATPAGSPEHKNRTVSLVRLLANPNAFHGKVVVVAGYATVAVENSALYLSEADAQHGIAPNAIWLNLPFTGEYPLGDRNPFHRKWVLVRGVFDAKKLGTGFFSGSLKVENYSDISIMGE